MFKRVKQFLRALTAKIDQADEDFLSHYLTTTEQALFQQMTLPDRRHSLNVAYCAQQLMKPMMHSKQRLLVRSALLHDIGRAEKNLSTAMKVMAVLFSAAFPNFSRRWSETKGTKYIKYDLANFRQVLFVYYHHGEMGACRLQKLGAEPEIIELVAKHHDLPAADDSPELVILRQADQMN
ncbi:putative nucleotidyltransferase with HDIG domain [Sporomusaceae bacterium BoRhaA]|uniref:HDIG domain-containing metalloprotein n=1 Tax=Pelorhabdus rhamnosifermentans TaxID=2772457 RepID=UPI001C064891|nr:HDIG domain-containing metalloprotein [Pelorhabdus rhamnosifermentans]MBU2702630.1 putative nucleotidyltransferase with HDIG domain [Pelorhabdus rhamnosifermentans]